MRLQIVRMQRAGATSSAVVLVDHDTGHLYCRIKFEDGGEVWRTVAGWDDITDPHLLADLRAGSDRIWNEAVRTEHLLFKYNWHWRVCAGAANWYELVDDRGHVLAWLQPRQHYCDRGHWQLNVDVPGLDEADRFPRYYMREEVARAECIEFLAWRLHKEPAQ